MPKKWKYVGSETITTVTENTHTVYKFLEMKPKVLVPATITIKGKIPVFIEQPNPPPTLYVMYEADPYEDEDYVFKIISK